MEALAGAVVTAGGREEEEAAEEEEEEEEEQLTGAVSEGGRGEVVEGAVELLIEQVKV